MAIHVNEKDHMQGSANAPIELVEYADYECPYCGEAYYTLKKIREELKDSLKLVFRNFPLVQMHQHALHAAVAAEVAAEEDKFWEMHDILFENQENLQDTYLIEYAEKIGLNVNQFKESFGNNKFYEKIKEDVDSGEKNGVEGTPTFFINGDKYNGNWMGEEFLDYLKSLLKG